MSNQLAYVRDHSGTRLPVHETVTRKGQAGETILCGVYVNRVRSAPEYLYQQELSELVYRTPDPDAEPRVFGAGPWRYNPWSGHVVVADGDAPRPLCYVDEAVSEGEEFLHVGALVEAAPALYALSRAWHRLMGRAYTPADLSAMADLTDELLRLFSGRIAALRREYAEEEEPEIPAK